MMTWTYVIIIDSVLLFAAVCVSSWFEHERKIERQRAERIERARNRLRGLLG